MNRKAKLKKTNLILVIATMLLCLPFSSNSNAELTDCGDLPGPACPPGTGCHILAYQNCTITCMNPVTGEQIGQTECKDHGPS